MPKMNLSIIIPCFNEVDNISKLHGELLPIVEEIVLNGWKGSPEKVNSAEMIFVDDGSRDETFSMLKVRFNKDKARLKFKFLKHDVNRGLGAALRTGFSNANGDVILTVDSDGTYKFSSIPELLSLLTPEVDIVTASPYHPAGGVAGVPAYRLILSRGSSFIYRILVDWRLYTYTCLYRAYRLSVIKNIPFKSNGFLAGTEILIKAMFKGYRVVEFPTVLYKRMYGVSKARILRTILSHLGFQGWVLFARVKLMLGLQPGRATNGSLNS
jgi:dolichol-phosphate mannosyltransferase